jgi:hypothetical protein
MENNGAIRIRMRRMFTRWKKIEWSGWRFDADALKAKTPASCWRATERIAVLPSNAYIPEVTHCQGPKWETLFAGSG